MSDFETRCTEDEVVALFDRLSNWGRWGRDDERGTLNFITPEKVREAGKLIQVGRQVSLGLDIVTRPEANVRQPALHIVNNFSADATSATDFIGLSFHGFAFTHMDALCHKFVRNQMYNGYAVDQVFGGRGPSRCSIHAMRDGVFSRGVLLDIPRTQGRDWLDAGEFIHVEDLEAAEAKIGTRLGRGDVLVIRVGQRSRTRTEGEENPFSPGFLRNGMGPDCLPWLHEREVAIYTGDTFDRIPSGYPGIRMPFHEVSFVAMGLPFLDNLAVEELSEVCVELGRWEFAFTFAPLRLRRGTGSPVNPLAIF